MGEIMNSKSWNGRRLVALMLGFTIIAAACGSDAEEAAPAATTAASSSASSRAPAIQPVQRSISFFASSGTAFCTKMSAI